MEVDTTKTKNFCETSVILDIDNVKNEAILRDFLQNSLCRNFIQFLSSHLTRCSEPTFRRSRASKHWKKNTILRLSYLFAFSSLILIFFLLDFFSSDSFSSLPAPATVASSVQKPKVCLLIFLRLSWLLWWLSQWKQNHYLIHAISHYHQLMHTTSEY